jgi:hypothetical protein
MHKKPTLLYSAGCYGAFCLQMLNLNEIMPSHSYHNQLTDYRYTQTNRPDHHLINEKDIDSLVIKITYTDDDVDLINRNKWTKVENHLKEQALVTFPNNKNNELYTMAIHKCNLLDKDNQFKKIIRKDTVEIRFSWLFYDLENWLLEFYNIFERLQIPVRHVYLKNCYDIFHMSQAPILKAHQEKNDLIEQSNQLANIYFQKHKIYIIYLGYINLFLKRVTIY